MKRILTLALVLAICCGFCSCNMPDASATKPDASATKYKVEFTDGSTEYLSSKEIVELYENEEKKVRVPTRDNPNPINILEGAIISGTGTVTSFDCRDDTSAKNSAGQYFMDEYFIMINDNIQVNFRTDKTSDVKLQLYFGDTVDFVGEISLAGTSHGAWVEINPTDGYHLRTGNSTGITLVE